MQKAVIAGNVIAFLEADKALDEAMPRPPTIRSRPGWPRRLQTHSRRFWFRYQSDTGLAAAAERHVALIRAILDGDAKARRGAKRLMRCCAMPRLPRTVVDSRPQASRPPDGWTSRRDAGRLSDRLRDRSLATARRTPPQCFSRRSAIAAAADWHISSLRRSGQRIVAGRLVPVSKRSALHLDIPAGRPRVKSRLPRASPVRPSVEFWHKRAAWTALILSDCDAVSSSSG